MAFNLVSYSQQDPQWKNSKIGPGPDTIGYIGCALTSLAMYSSSWGFTETPATLNQKLTANGGITADELLVWGAISKLYSQIQSTGLTICTNSDAPISQINASLAAGQPVIVEVDYSPDPGLQTHWVLVYAQQGNDYLIQDPWPYPSETTPVTLMTRFSQGQPLQRAIKAVAWYQCNANGSSASSGTSSGSTTTTPSTPAPSTSLPTPIQTGLYVQVVATATAGLRLHTQPSADSPANAAEMPGTQLQVIEDKTGALAKIGVTNQWLYVSDPSGNQGYVAAWFVQQVQGSAPTSTPAPASTSTPAPNPAPTPPTSSTPSTSSSDPASQPQRLVLQVISAVGPGGLRLRAFPSLAGSLVGIEKAGTFLTVIEPSNSALAKVGVANQWINVRDPNGLRGYVMASYVAAG
ncbi:MAG TPA: SH3 domain-containing protein [Anaerolineales bacterium]